MQEYSEPTYPDSFRSMLSLPEISDMVATINEEDALAKKIAARFGAFNAPKGFQFISLGDSIMKDEDNLNHIPRETLHQAAEQTVKLLTDTQAYREMVETNFRLGKQNFSYQNTLSILTKLLA